MPLLARNRPLVSSLRLFWIFSTLWYELWVFNYHVRQCQWPQLGGTQTPARILIVADPQILDHRSYPGRAPLLTYLSRLVSDLYIRKNWRAALRIRPEHVVFLGDMMDGARWTMSDEEYEAYFSRFKRIFALDSAIPQYFIPGNHDIGLGSSTLYSPQARERFVSHFGPLNSQITVAGHPIIFLNSLSLVEEEYARVSRAISYKDWSPFSDGSIAFVNSVSKHTQATQPILFSHIPLYRPLSTNCGPLREKGTIRPGIGFGYQNTLEEHTTTWLLDQLKPAIIFSGDDHDYCEYNHIDTQLSSTREVSVKSLSMVMGIRKPGFQLLSVSPSSGSVADSPCFMPDQLGIYLGVYIPLLVISLLLVVASKMARFSSVSNDTPAYRPIFTRHHSSSGSQLSPNDIRLRSRFGTDSDSDDGVGLPVPASAKLRQTFFPSRKQGYWALFLGIIYQANAPASRGGVRGFLRDVVDVAVFPLGIFVLVTCWVTWT